MKTKNSESGGGLLWLVPVISLILLGYLAWNTVAVQGVFLQKAEANYIRSQAENAFACIRQVDQTAGKLAFIVTDQAAVAKACTTGDTTDLEEILGPLYKQWRQNAGVEELSIVSAAGHVVWSSRTDIKAGEDMSYQRVVAKGLLQKELLSVPESDGDHIMLVTTRPIFYNDTYAGMCKISITTRELGRQLKKSGSGSLALYHLNGIESTLLWETQKTQPSLNTADIKKLQEGGVISRRAGLDIQLLITPLQDVDGVTVAYLQNQLSLRSFWRAKIFNYSTLAAAFLLAALAICAPGRRRLDRPQERGERYISMPKISRVSFNINTDKSHKYENKE